MFCLHPPLQNSWSLNSQEAIDEYMAGKWAHQHPDLGPHTVDEDCSNEDSKTIQEFEEFKKWLQETADPKPSQPPLRIPCYKCNRYPCPSLKV